MGDDRSIQHLCAAPSFLTSALKPLSLSVNKCVFSFAHEFATTLDEEKVRAKFEAIEKKRMGVYDEYCDNGVRNGIHKCLRCMGKYEPYVLL